MIKVAALLALGLSLTACSTAGWQSSGASGIGESNVGVGYGRGVGIDSCAPDDTNCREIYLSPGGG